MVGPGLNFLIWVGSGQPPQDLENSPKIPNLSIFIPRVKKYPPPPIAHTKEAQDHWDAYPSLLLSAPVLSEFIRRYLLPTHPWAPT